MIGGGSESHLEGCSRYSRHSMPFMKGTSPRLPSRTQPSSKNLRNTPMQHSDTQTELKASLFPVHNIIIHSNKNKNFHSYLVF